MNEIFRYTSEQDKRQPYRADLGTYLSTVHARIVPPGTTHIESHKSLEIIEKRAALILQSSDNAAYAISRPEFLSILKRQKAERGDCAIGISICIDGRMSPMIVAGPAINVSEAKGGLILTEPSPLDGTPEIASARLTEAIIDRPLKDSSQILEILTYHGDLSKGNSFVTTATLEDIDCKAILQRIDRKELPKKNSIRTFRIQLEHSGEAIGRHYNNSASLLGYKTLQRVAIPAFYDTRTAGFIFGDDENQLFTTELTSSILNSKDFSILTNIAPPDLYRNSFTKSEVTTTRESVMVDIEHAILTKSSQFNEVVNNHIDRHMGEGEFTALQLKAFRFFVARNIALQYVTGLYHGGAHPLAEHNEKYIAFSLDGQRIGQFDSDIQSFGATVSNHADTLDHLKTKLSLMDHLGKSKPPHIAFLSKSQPESGSMSVDRSIRAELRSTIKAIYQDPEVLARVKAGELVLIPTVLQEKTGIVKSIPNLAI